MRNKKTGHFYFAQNRTFLLCVDSPHFFLAFPFYPDVQLITLILISEFFVQWEQFLFGERAFLAKSKYQ